MLRKLWHWLHDIHVVAWLVDVLGARGFLASAVLLVATPVVGFLSELHPLHALLLGVGMFAFSLMIWDIWPRFAASFAYVPRPERWMSADEARRQLVSSDAIRAYEGANDAMLNAIAVHLQARDEQRVGAELQLSRARRNRDAASADLIADMQHLLRNGAVVARGIVEPVRHDSAPTPIPIHRWKGLELSEDLSEAFMGSVHYSHLEYGKPRPKR